jgi:uncharacterized membrane protein YdjX (TVP38/TMEM64 family)
MIERLHELIQACEGLGYAGLIGVAAVFAVGSLSYMPRFTLYAIVGLVFGLAAIPAAIVGSTIGATLAFWLARTVWRKPFERRIADRPRWATALSVIDAESWRLVALTRIAAPLPGGAINYLYGLTGIGVVPYATGTAIGLVPPITLFAGAGAFGRLALTDLERPWSQLVAVGAGALVIAIAVTLVLRRMRATLSPR